MSNVIFEISLKIAVAIQWIVISNYDRNISEVYKKKNKVNIKDEI